MVRFIFSLLAAACLGSAWAATPLAFSEFYLRPIGPRGLEATPKLLGLTGQRVELSGFIARPAQERALILAPMPVTLNDEDEALADDLPASVAYVHAVDARQADTLVHCPGAVRVSGVLDTGARLEADDRRSFVRVQVDTVQCLAPRR